MSFALTTEAVRSRQKTVTRRAPGTWSTLRSGDRLAAVEKSQGVPKGQKAPAPICTIEIVDVRVEPVALIDDQDMTREGFPGVDPAKFVRMWRRMYRGEPMCRRIEFEFVEESNA